MKNINSVADRILLIECMLESDYRFVLSFNIYRITYGVVIKLSSRFGKLNDGRTSL